MNIFRHKKNILVLGSDGMLGHDVLSFLTKLASTQHSDIGLVVGIDVKDGVDLTQRHALASFIKSKQYALNIRKPFDYCINCVAYTNTYFAEKYDAGYDMSYKLNALVPKYIAETCATMKMKLIHVSTDYVFSEKSNTLLNSGVDDCSKMYAFSCDDEQFPVNMYGLHKLLGENFIQLAMKPNDYAILRVSWLYGMHNNKSFIHKFMKNVVSKLNADPNAQITMTSNERSVPTSTNHVVMQMMNVICNGKHGIIHAVPRAPSNGVSRLEFANRILTSYIDEEQVNGVKLNSLTLKPVESSSYQPEFSAMIADVHEYTSWEDDLNDFMTPNVASILKWAKDECSKDFSNCASEVSSK